MRPSSFRFLTPIALLAAGTGSPAAEPAPKASTETVAYGGWAHNVRLSNGEVEVIATLDVGPRILVYRPLGGKNVFKEYAEQLGKSGESEWMIRGGHRLWTAPEDATRTYALDNGPVRLQQLGPLHVRLTPGPETAYGLQKEIDLRLAPRGSGVTVTHRITNVGAAPTDLSVWASSVMAPGGVELIPLPPKAPHPGSVKNARTADAFSPNQLYVAWPYTDFDDSRWSLGSKSISLRQDPKKGPTKLGIAHRTGGIGYLNAGVLFVKRFAYEPGKPYPEFGCNYETFTREDMLELETLAPLVRLAPGQGAEHVERWSLVTGLSDAPDRAGLEASLLPSLLSEKAD